MEKEKEEKERMEKERLEQERLEQERMEKEKEEQERLEQERLEKERLEKERIEKERLEKERLEQERMEKARMEKEKEEQERKEKERLEKEQEAKEREEKERKEKKLKEQKKEEDIDEKTGITITNYMAKELPEDPGHYLEFTLQTKKKTIFIPTQANLERFRRDVLKRHNYYRQFHQVGPLALTKKLNDFAQNCAENMAKKNEMKGYSFDEMKKLLGDLVGETLYHTKTSGKKALTMSGPKVVDYWYEAIKYYNFEQAGDIDKIDGRASNFTQIVWKESTELGVGIAGSSNNNIFVVANYQPKGNWIRNFPENVFPVKLSEEMEEQKKKEKEKEEEKKKGI